MNKKPKFFCEFCGAEVKQNDKICKKCGKFFASVKCPKCGKTGDSRLFSDGCPVCGYAVPPDTPFPARNAGRRQSAGDRAHRHSDDPLPLWVYAGAGLLCAIGIIIAAVYLRQ